MRFHRFIHPVALTALVIATAGNARADLIRITDVDDSIPLSVTARDFPQNLDVLANFDEFLHFTYTSSLPVAPGQGGLFYTDLLESDGSLSDRILFGLVVGSPVIDVQFASDPNMLDITNARNIAVLVEDGTYQTVAVYFNVGTGVPVDTYQVASDIPTDVPEPGTVGLLIALGATGAGLLARRRRVR
jgi:hypothetical protein